MAATISEQMKEAAGSSETWVSVYQTVHYSPVEKPNVWYITHTDDT